MWGKIILSVILGIVVLGLIGYSQNVYATTFDIREVVPLDGEFPNQTNQLTHHSTTTVIDSDKLYLVFGDEDVTQEEFFFQKFNGTTQTPVKIDDVQSGFGYEFFASSIVVNNGVIDIVYAKEVGGGGTPQEYYFTRSTDDGDTFSTPLLVSSNVIIISQILTTGDSTIRILYHDNTDDDTFIIKSTNGGTSFGARVLVSSPVAVTTDNISFDLAVDGTTLHFVHRGTTTEQHLYYTKSTDSGDSWTTSIQLDDGVTGAIDVLNGQIYFDQNDSTELSVLWNKANGGFDEIRLVTSSDTGTSWSTSSLVIDSSTCNSAITVIPEFGMSRSMSHFENRVSAVCIGTGNLGVYEMISLDFARTWTPLTEIGTPNPTGFTGDFRPSVTNWANNMTSYLFTQGSPESFYYAESIDGGATLNQTTVLLSPTISIVDSDTHPVLVGDNSLWIVFRDGFDATNPNKLQFFTNEIDPSTVDSDNDGLLDSEEDANGNGIFEPLLGETDPNNSDTDGDSLLDGWEVKGIDGSVPPDGIIDFQLISVNPLRADIFLEYDYMQFVEPDPIAIHNVRTAFANSPYENPDGSTGINLWVDLDPEQIPNEQFWVFDGRDWTDYFDSKELFFMNNELRNHPDAAAIKAAKLKAYHYGVFIDAPIFSSSGLSNGIPSGDFVVSISSFFNFDHNFIAHTLMHELGHNLGLYHGGSFPPDHDGDGDIDGIDFRSDNCKPNYLSVMSYSRQSTWLTFGYTPLINLQSLDTLDYSRSKLANLTENDLREIDGIEDSDPSGLRTLIGDPNQSIEVGLPIDWNLDFDVNDENVIRDINFVGYDPIGLTTICGQPSSTDQTLSGHDDWDNLVFDFPPPGLRSGTASGADLVPEITSDIVQMIKDEVTQGNTAPVLAPVGDKTIDELTELFFVVSATDLDVPEQEILYSVFSKPLGAVMDMNTGEFTWTPTEEQGPGVYTIDISATDGIVNVLETVIITVNDPSSSITLNASKDGFLTQGNAKQNDGVNPILMIKSSDKFRPVIAFNQTIIETAAAGETLQSAKLQLYITDNGNNWGSNGRNILIHTLTQDWIEGNGWNKGNNISGDGSGVTWNCPIDSDISNNQDDCTNQWNGGSFTSIASDTVLITNDMINQFIEFDVTSDVQAFLDNTSTNFGWIIKKGEEALNGALDFKSKEAYYQPKLILTFE